MHNKPKTVRMKYFKIVFIGSLHDYVFVLFILSTNDICSFSIFYLVSSGMPVGPYLYASDLNEVLKKKHASGSYKSLVSH